MVVGVSSGWCVTSAIEEAQTGCWSGIKRGEGGEGLGRQASATENTYVDNLVKFAGGQANLCWLWFLWW